LAGGKLKKERLIKMNEEYEVYLKKNEEIDVTQFFKEMNEIINWQNFNTGSKFYTECMKTREYFEVQVDHDGKRVLLF
jgi:hypothetical protein